MIDAKKPNPSAAEAQVLKDLAAELRSAMQDRGEVDRRIDELRGLIERLEARYGISPEDEASQLAGVSTTRVGQVHAVLRQGNAPMSVAQITEALAEMGITYSNKAIASALSYLGSSERAERIGRGLWQAK